MNVTSITSEITMINRSKSLKIWDLKTIQIKILHYQLTHKIVIVGAMILIIRHLLLFSWSMFSNAQGGVKLQVNLICIICLPMLIAANRRRLVWLACWDFLIGLAILCSLVVLLLGRYFFLYFWQYFACVVTLTEAKNTMQWNFSNLL